MMEYALKKDIEQLEKKREIERIKQKREQEKKSQEMQIRRRTFGIVEDYHSSGIKTKGSNESSNLRMNDKEWKGKEEDDLLLTEIGDSEQRKSSCEIEMAMLNSVEIIQQQSPKKQNNGINKVGVGL
ncbi:MAG: hypothetical protein EZS28_031977 [Streblomastix strix]|uniref:Uncharacterized protein n=1 Tax=Streblomastix strix TaxID=222440 RepID=A0A5J4UQ30_9EUKA|nr:MAG: hypothetical protein EZS28_031977 [Streblomastix strix]